MLKYKNRLWFKSVIILIVLSILCIVGYIGGKPARIAESLNNDVKSTANNVITLLLKNNGNNLGTYLIAFDKTIRILDVLAFQYQSGKQIEDSTKVMTLKQKDMLKKTMLINKEVAQFLVDSIKVNLDRQVDSTLTR